ncbi:nuclear transport factor 2 family protein [Streptomyces sp. Z26]|uniref:nuclear transport factor 2 family protein n=1 Tax=Streptomyces sp. Z26 TaxID=2500177 RepID=UPI000EF174D8|nr:nuclear transport factor 2 family protein [Streptomyces sp. Z26]RLL69918.1 nuclear transport factor 2 family protein [Streptomyces sp. Z26]
MPRTTTGQDTPAARPGHCALERRLRLLEDREALRSLLHRGWWALDRRDWGTWIGCWAEDAVLEFGPWEEVRGRDAIRARVEEAESAYPSMQHHLLNLDFDVDAEHGRATGTGYMWFVAVTAPGLDTAPYAMGGPYDWEFRRDDGAADGGQNNGGWRLTRQRLGVWWTTGEDRQNSFG